MCRPRGEGLDPAPTHVSRLLPRHVSVDQRYCRGPHPPRSLEIAIRRYEAQHLVGIQKQQQLYKKTPTAFQEPPTHIPKLTCEYKWTSGRAEPSCFGFFSLEWQHLHRKIKEENSKAVEAKNKEKEDLFAWLPFSGPPAFDSSTSWHACQLRVHPSLVRVWEEKNNSRAKKKKKRKKKITGNQQKRIQMTRVSRQGPVSGSRPHPDTGDPWQVAAFTNMFSAMARGEEAKGEATEEASFGWVNEWKKRHWWNSWTYWNNSLVGVLEIVATKCSTQVSSRIWKKKYRRCRKCIKWHTHTQKLWVVFNIRMQIMLKLSASFKSQYSLWYCSVQLVGVYAY